MTTKFNIFNIVITLLLIDLILGGSGQIITIGPISLRMLIFVLAMLTVVYSVYLFGIRLNDSFFTVSFFLFIISISFFLGIFNNNESISVLLNELFGYLPILFYPLFYQYTISNVNMKKILILIERLITIQSVIVILIAAYALIVGINAYTPISTLMNQYNYGAFDFILGTHVPRVFTKGSIFIPMLIIYKFAQVLSGEKRKISEYLVLAINSLALIFTFTTSFFLVTIVGIIFVVFLFSKNKRTYLIVLFLGIIFFVMDKKFNFIATFLQRFSGDYNVNFKFLQNEFLLATISEKPFLGYGLGKILTIDYGYETRTGIHVENAFLQLGINAGLIGMLTLTLLIYYIVHSEWILLKKCNFFSGNILLLFSIVSVFIINFTNPFLNNYIGTTVLAINIGIMEGLKWKQSYIL